MRKNGKNRIANVLILLFAVVLFPPRLSYGHVFPHHSDPKAGSTVTTAPAVVRIWFDGDLEPAFSKIAIEDANGKKVDKGDTQVDPADPKLLHVGTSSLSPGKYRVAWDVVSRDGHRTNGDFSFTIK